jgi:hypothetical protein
MTAIAYANIEEQFAGCVPPVEDVFDALLFAGFDVATVYMRQINRLGNEASYRICVRGSANEDAWTFMETLQGAFCEQSTVLMLYTKDNDVYLVLQLKVL